MPRDAQARQARLGRELAPPKIANTLAFMFETRLVIHPTAFALSTGALQRDYDACWSGFESRFQDR
jgi:homogentisate 1,2-dioxygenase